MTASRGRGVVAWALIACLVPAAGVSSEELPPAPAAEMDPAPAPTDLVRMIGELGSVRDYERLRWVLDGIERQVPAMRADLLQQLDDRVQELLSAEVELRTATALASAQQLQLSAIASADRPVQAAEGQDAQQAVQAASAHAEDAYDRLRNGAPSAEEVERSIRSWRPSGTPEEQVADTNRMMQSVFAVKDPNKRQALFTMLQDRRRDVFIEQMNASRDAAAEEASRLPHHVEEESGS